MQDIEKKSSNRPKVMKTVWPDQTLTQPEWLKYVKAGIMVRDRGPVERAHDMMKQYDADGAWLDKFVKMIRG